MSVLADLVTAIASGTIEVIDLTAPLSAQTPILKLPEPLGQTWRFGLQEISRYNEAGPGWYWQRTRPSAGWAAGRPRGAQPAVCREVFSALGEAASDGVETLKKVRR